MEERLYLEAELMFKKESDFKTIEGDLRKWVGHVKTKQEDLTLTINMYIPDTFPSDPPIIKISPPIIHSIIDESGKLNLKLLENWNHNFHLYQIVNILKASFWNEPPKRLYSAVIEKRVAQQKQEPALKENGIKVDEKINVPSKEEMGKKIQEQFSLDSFSPTLKDKVLDLQSEKISTINLVEYLDDMFQKGEMSPTSYSKLYKKYYDILVLINEELRKIKQG